MRIILTLYVLFIIIGIAILISYKNPDDDNDHDGMFPM